MKISCRNIKNSLLVFALLAMALPAFSAGSSDAFAEKKKKTESSGLALTVQGEVFVVSENRTRPLETSDYIYDFSEIVTSDNGQVTFKDKFDHKYHMAPGTHIKILNRIIELKTGYLWVKSENQEKGFSVQTANAKVLYNEGEAIVTFDSFSGKTQLLVVHGEMEFGNILLDENKVVVTDSNFSFLTGEYQNSVPRTPTSIGQASFSKIVNLFMGVKPEQGMLAQGNTHEKKGEHAVAPVSHETKKEVAHAPAPVAVPHVAEPSRSIASVPETEDKKEAGKFIYVTKTRDELLDGDKTKKLEELYKSNLQNLEKSKPKKPKLAYTPDYSKKSSVTIKIYGQKKTASPARLPASVVEPVNSSSSLDEMARDMKEQNEASDLIRQLNHFKAE